MHNLPLFLCGNTVWMQMQRIASCLAWILPLHVFTFLNIFNWETQIERHAPKKTKQRVSVCTLVPDSLAGALAAILANNSRITLQSLLSHSTQWQLHRERQRHCQLC